MSLLLSCRSLSASSWVSLIFALLIGLMPPVAMAQGTSVDDERERLTVERFLQVLLKRPRPGTSLDRVYGYHVRSGSLDDLLVALQEPTSEEAAELKLNDVDEGSGKMVLGLMQLQRGKSAAAVQALKQAEELLLQDAACSYYLGKAHLAIGETELAAAAMERAIDRAPARNEALPIFTELGRIYGRAGAAEKALNVWTRLEKLFPGDSRVGGQIAETLADEGKTEEALKRFESLANSARKDEEKIAFAVQAAEMKRRLGKPEEATADLESILNKLRPGSWLYTDVRNRIEDGFLKSGDVDALADYYQKRLEADADNLELMSRLGRILVSAGRLEEARATLEDAVERAPEDAEVRLGLVDILERQSKITEAGQQYEQLAKQDPSNPDYLLKWGQLLLEDQKQELPERRKAAAKIWQRLADARNDDAVTLAQVADRMRAVDQSDDAIALYQKAIDLDPTAPQYREYLGEYYHQLDRKDDAIKVWEAIAEGDRRNVDSLIRLAEIFGTFKLSERSLETWKAAAELNLTFSQELRYANQLRAAKKFDDALERLAVAEKIAETPDERDQLLSDRITTYSEAGTLPDKIAALEKTESPSIGQLRELALMHQAAGQLTDASVVIKAALQQEPENISLLSVAAEILERQNLFDEAVTYYRKLSSADRRFQTNYLEKVAQLQVRLGLAEDALATCDELIQANPASTDTYLFAARTAFQLGRNDDGVEVLRRAMIVARRDNGPRKLLASEFAKQYRTDEAIDLYWQALDFESKIDDRIAIVRNLAPLYERRAEIETLLSRIEEIGAKDNDVRATQLMIAAANEAIQDYGAARNAVDRLLARQPRDVGLLEAMVRLCDASNELEMAIDFQQRIVTLADTPENRFRLVNLQLDAGTIDIATALTQRLSMANDPSRIMGLIQSAARRGDAKTAILVAKEALRKDDSLWDVKLTLAQILLHQNPTDTEAAKAEDSESNTQNPHEEAVALCRQILSLNVPNDQRPPTVKVTKGRANQPSSRTTPQYWGQSSYQIARQYQLGQYARYNYGNQSGIAFVQATSFGHAKVLAETFTWVPNAQTLPKDEMVAYLKEEFQEYTLPKDLSKVTKPESIWMHQALQSMAGYLVEGEVVLDPAAEKNSSWRGQLISWRLFELAPEAGSSAVVNLIRNRLQRTAKYDALLAKQKSQSDMGEETIEVKRPNPLKERQLELLVAHYDRTVKKIESNPKQSRSQLLTLTAAMKNEFLLAGKPEIAAKYQPEELDDDAPYNDVLAAIQFYLSLNEIEKADQLIPKMLQAVRSAQASGAKITGLAGNSINGSFSGMIGGNAVQAEFFKKHRLELLDAIVAATVHNQAMNARGRRTVSAGSVSVYRQSQGGGYRSTQVQAPLSPELMDQALAREITSLHAATVSESESGKVSDVDEQVIERLLQTLPGAPAYELKARAVSAAFAYWWKKNPERCYEILSDLAKQYPDDVNVRIEQARLASELGDDREALDILNSFEPLDSKMLVRKEMAALNLAARLSDEARAAQAAERLFGMRIDTATQLALSEQLRQLGMKDKAAAVLQRLRGGRRQDDRTSLQIAQSFMAADDKAAAAEVAFQVLRSLNRSRNQQGNYEYYKRQAVDILKSAKRLDPLIAMAKRRVDSSPKSVSARTELAELYTAAGRKEDADKLWAAIAEDTPANPAQMISRAKGLTQAGKHQEAVDLYLKAFEKEPQRIENQFYELRNAVQQAKAWDKMYTGLLKVPANRIPEYRIDELIQGDYNSRAKEFSDAKMKFVIHVLEGAAVGRSLYQILDSIPEKQRAEFPQIRTAIIRTVTADSAFEPNSPTWSIYSYSGDGTTKGGVIPVVEFLAADEEARAKFEAAAQKQLSEKDNGKAQMARFLKALVQLKVGGEEQVLSASKDVLALLKEMEESEARKNGSADRSTWNGRFSEAFTWQAGTLMESVSGIPDKTQFLITVYESSRTGEINVNGGDPRYSVLHPLIKAYRAANQSEKAVRGLMKAYRSLDNSEQNQYNPGYGDYQDLQSWKWIAEQLQNSGAPLQALSIYRRALAAPEKFDNAKRWGGGQTAAPFEIGAKKAVASVNEESAIRFLKSHISELQDSATAKTTIDLQMLPIKAFEEPDMAPGFLMAIQEAKKTEDGLAALQELAAALEQQANKEGAHWSITGAQLMVATAINPDQIPTLSTHLMTLLPTEEQIQESPARQTEYLDSFAVALALSEIDSSEAKAAVQKVKPVLISIARAKSEADSLLVLENRFGDKAAAVERMLTELETSVDGKAPNKAQVALVLKIALNSAKDEEWATSVRALKAALGHGPPLTGIASGSRKDAFAINTNQSSPNVSQLPDDRAVLTTEVLKLTDIYRKNLGLVKKHPDVWKNRNQSDEQKRVSNLVFDALMAVVIPDSSTPQIVLYNKGVVSTNQYDQFSSRDGNLEFDSAAQFLAEVAKLSGRLDEVKKRLTERTDLTSREATSLAIHLAVQQEDAAQLLAALEAFEQSVTADLPSPDAQMVGSSGSYSITSQMQTESFAKSRLINNVLNVIWNIDRDSKVKDEQVTVVIDRLLHRITALIGSDRYTMNRHRQVMSMIQSRSVQDAAAIGDQSLMSSILRGITNSISNRYSTSDAKTIARQKQQTLTQLLGQLSEAGNLAKSHGLIRQVIESQAMNKPDYKSSHVASTLISISKLSQADQYELLKKITLGDRDDDEVMHWMGFVRAADVPELVRAQTPNYGDHKNLPLASKVAPLSDSALMLAKLAVETGQAEQLMKTLRERSKQPMDTADLIATLVQLNASGENGFSELEDTFTVMLEGLKKNKPTSDDPELKVPELQILLTIQAMERGMPASLANQLTNVLKSYSVHAQKNPLTAVLGAVRATAEFGRTSGGTVNSPLKHFVAYSVPWYSDPETEDIRSLHAVNETGWVSSTSGYNVNLLMLKYPVAGSFSMSANIKDGSWGEADVSYGGVMYQPAGWNKQASINVLRSSDEVKVPVENIVAGQVNQEGLEVTSEKVVGLCNGVSYFEDLSTASFPWPAVSQYAYRTTQWKDFQITGSPVIPRQVNLLDATMRGWGTPNYSRLPPHQIPDPEKHTAEDGVASSAYDYQFKDGVLLYDVPDTSDQYDSGHHLQYLRPLLDAETVTWKFFWEEGKTETYPSIGRIVLRLSKKGIVPTYRPATQDLSSVGFISHDELYPLPEPLAKDNVPVDGEWNTVTLVRQGNAVQFKLNEKLVATIPVTNLTARPGFQRVPQMNSKIKDMILTGDWPDTLPEDLMERSE